jgi:hypothetical protein
LPSGQEGPLPIEQTPIGQSSPEKTYLEGKDIRPETHQALRQMCSKMYQPERLDYKIYKLKLYVYI